MRRFKEISVSLKKRLLYNAWKKQKCRNKYRKILKFSTVKCA